MMLVRNRATRVIGIIDQWLDHLIGLNEALFVQNYFMMVRMRVTINALLEEALPDFSRNV
uniref:Uncharacterized protein n=1 Tax=Meloidogyne incognita TaxID=6306 RepID=A0A914L4W6_MELIC